MERVFATPELLENILLSLPLPDLLQARRISKHTDGVISTSPRIQQALFLSPAASLPRSERTTSLPPIQPLDCPAAEVLSSRSETGYVLNPLLAYHFPYWFELKIYESNYEQRSHHNFQNLPMGDNKERLDAFMRPQASWRRMLISQPPIPRLKLLRTSSGQLGLSCYSGQVDLENEDGGGEGVRMGVLYDLCYSWIFVKERVAWWSIEWNCLPRVNAADAVRPEMRQRASIRGLLPPGSSLDRIEMPEPEDEPDSIALHLGSVFQCTGRRPSPLPAFISQATKRRSVKMSHLTHKQRGQRLGSSQKEPKPYTLDF